jgi:hypothetical protein
MPSRKLSNRYKQFKAEKITVTFKLDPYSGEVTPYYQGGYILDLGGLSELWQGAMEFYRRWPEAKINDYNFDLMEANDTCNPDLAPSPESSRRPGFIYLLKSEADYYKIGKSHDVPKRYNTLKVQVPHKVELAHVLPTSDMVWAEKYLHSRYAFERLNGEWFALSDDSVEEIIFLSRIDPRPDIDQYISDLWLTTKKATFELESADAHTQH